MCSSDLFDKAHRIISVSKFECDRIKEFLNLPSEKIKVVYNGFSKHFTPLENPSLTSCKYIDSDDYLFFLGNTDPKKNASRVLKAYSIYLKNSEKKRPLLIADLKESVLKEILAKENISDIMPYIDCPGYINNSNLPAVYSGAFAFLYPSLRESFGIPLIGAMACGRPVVSSDVYAIPEIASDAA